jgi:hypothetical protein
MTENQDQKINPTCLFLVTGASFALFALLLDLIDSQNIKIFWGISVTSLILGSLAAVVGWLKQLGSNTKEEQGLKEHEKKSEAY